MCLHEEEISAKQKVKVFLYSLGLACVITGVLVAVNYLRG
jgi:hypothetical protein